MLRRPESQLFPARVPQPFIRERGSFSGQEPEAFRTRFSHPLPFVSDSFTNPVFGLPAILHQRTNLFVIDAPHPCHYLFGEAWQVRSLAVVHNLLGPLAARNGAGYCVEHEDPAQSQLTHRDPGWQERSHLFDRLKADVVIHAGECLSHIKGLSLAIEIPVVVCREGGIATEFTRQQTAGERHTGEDAYPLLFGSREELVRWSLPETVENDLHRLDVGESIFSTLTP